jgi:hypothetical protein
MGQSYYCYEVLIPSSSALTFETVQHLFESRLTKTAWSPKLFVSPKLIRLTWDDWSMRIYWEDADHVELEYRERAAQSGVDPAISEMLRTCDRRITTAGDPDPEMDHLNDCIYVLETLNKLNDVLRVDVTGKFVAQFGD